MSDKRFLGYGKSRKYGEIALEEGNQVFAVNEAEFFCPHCDRNWLQLD